MDWSLGTLVPMGLDRLVERRTTPGTLAPLGSQLLPVPYLLPGVVSEGSRSLLDKNSSLLDKNKYLAFKGY